MTDARIAPPPVWLGGPEPDHPPDDGRTLVADALEEAWAEHQQGRDADTPTAAELPGGAVWQAIYEEAQAFAGSDPKDFWNRLSEDERGRYATLAAIQRRQRVDPPTRNPNLRFISARELVASTPPDIRWVVRHLLARGALTEIDGAAKRAGKTTFLGFMFRSLLAGGPFLGWPTERTRIVLLSEMHDTPLIQLLHRTGLAETDDLRILKWADSRLVRWPDVVADSIAECAEFGAAAFVTDTLPQWAGIRGDSENDAGAALAAIEPLQAAAASGLAVAIVRHERKGGGVVGESGRGSTAFTGAVDIVVRLAQPLNPQRETIRQLSVLSRFDGAPADLMIELGETGYEVLGEETKVAFSEAQAAVLKSLSQTSYGVRETDIVAMAGGAKGTVGAALRELIDRGEVERLGRGVSNSPYIYRRTLTPDVANVSPEVSPGAEMSVSQPVPPKGDWETGGPTSVGERMAAILEEPEDLDVEPEDPDWVGDVEPSPFGDGPGAGLLA